MIMDVDAAIWRCEECYLPLIDGKCHHCHGVLRCGTCEWQLEYGICPKCQMYCEACGSRSVNGRCASCEAGEEMGKGNKGDESDGRKIALSSMKRMAFGAVSTVSGRSRQTTTRTVIVIAKTRGASSITSIFPRA